MRTPPRRFAITDSLTGGSEDSDPRTRQFLVSNLVKVGFSGLSGLTREELRAHEMPYTTGGDQSLPGACPADGTQSASNVAAWAKKFVAATRGPPGPDQFAKSEITDMAMWDEAGWGFGAAWAPFNDSSSLVPLWVAFLKARNVTPADLGAIGSRKTLVGGPNMDSVESDVFSSLSRCVPEHLPPLPPSLPACQRTFAWKTTFWESTHRE